MEWHISFPELRTTASQGDGGPVFSIEPDKEYYVSHTEADMAQLSSVGLLLHFGLC